VRRAEEKSGIDMLAHIPLIPVEIVQCIIFHHPALAVPTLGAPVINANRILGNAFSLFGSINHKPLPIPFQNIDEMNFKVNEKIKIISSSLSVLSKNHFDSWIDLQPSIRVKEDDMMILTIASSISSEISIPKGFKKIINVTTDDGLSVVIVCKKYNKNDKGFYRIYRNSETLFANIMTVRGMNIVVDARGYKNSSSGTRGLAFTPRVETVDLGAIFSVFFYDDPHKINIFGQKNIVAENFGSYGIAIGVSDSFDGTSDRIKAVGDKIISSKYSGDDISIAFSVY